jgi:enoyl-CoA hydratase/carnithine racemase
MRAFGEIYGYLFALSMLARGRAGGPGRLLPVHRELHPGARRLRRRPCARLGITAVVLTGAGPAFCAGANLADLLAAAEGDPTWVRRVYGGFDRVRRSPLVTIAAVNGSAVGGG